MGFIGSVIILSILIFLLDKISNKLLGVEKKKISETQGKKADFWGRGVILVIMLCTLPFTMNDLNFVKWYFGLYAVLLLGFQAILEWKYIKNSKQYVTTIILLMFTLFIIYNLDYFFIFSISANKGFS